AVDRRIIRRILTAIAASCLLTRPDLGSNRSSRTVGLGSQTRLDPRSVASPAAPPTGCGSDCGPATLAGSHLGHPTSGDATEVVGRETEHGVRMAAGGPDRVPLHEGFVGPRCQRRAGG